MSLKSNELNELIPLPSCRRPRGRTYIIQLHELNEKMTAERAKANNLEHADQKASAYCNKVKPMFDDIRECCDEIERVCDDAEWTLPKYRELLSLS